MEQLSRRRLLAACAAGSTAAFAGCVDPDVAMFVDPVSSDREIAGRATIQPDAGSEFAATVGNATANGTEAPSDGEAGRPPFQVDRPVVHDGRVYDLDWESTGRTETRTEHVVSLTAHDDGRETEIGFDDLPEIDRQRLQLFVRELEQYDEAAGDDDPERPLPEAAFQHYYTDAEREASALVPDPEYETVAVLGYPTSVDVRSTEVELDVYRYTTTERASSLAAFGRELRTAHRFELTGLDESERDFFESVIEEGSYYQGTLGDDQAEAFEGVADRLVDRPAVFVEDREGEWLVGYDGNDYWVRVDFVRMKEYADQLQRVDEL
ncbi:hypothetical protein [Halohasta salina]|uniref:hypothetical protein n=1 Tax=Halohasta salina TaxID=2961621 RepID=UPI0020A5BCDB|nr:hypothetical protein [Halohasta salina]